MIFYKVLLAIGPDKPGIVNTVSAFLTERGCNLEDSKMSVLGEDFALVMLFSGALNSIEKVKADIKSLESSVGLTTLLKDTKAPTVHRKEASIPYKLEAFGMDHPGIVNEITGVLHKNRINVESMETGVGNAPVSGTPVFHMYIKMTVPASLPISKLKDELSKVEGKQNLNITLSPSEI
ncbi:MAG: hypothetical protein A2452_12765 [Candidatus Firestonebacteria bacterium RIFOXYC2_FULL_39_67]|nr:MAG: hypothetical protein A2452_12765 [Candidatus Firestonebacteria bacterium RIFOXYC2_FULL_39_67]